VANDPVKTFGKNLHKLRNEAGLTQEMLAEQADISRRFLQEIEAGEKSPSVIKASQLQKALGCSWEELTYGI